MIQIKLRSTPRGTRALVGAIFPLIFFGGLFYWLHNWVAGALFAVTLIGMSVLAWAKWQVSTTPPTYIGPSADWRPNQPPASYDDGVFRVRQVTGIRARAGLVIMGTHSAGFLPTSRWRFIWRVGWYAQEIEVKVFDRSSIDAAIADFPRYGGFIVDSGWLWAVPGGWLFHRDAKTGLLFRPLLPQHLLPRWQRTPVDREKQRKVVSRLAFAGGAFILALLSVGVLLWQVNGDSKYIVGFGSWAVVLAIGLAAGLLLGRRRVR